MQTLKLNNQLIIRDVDQSVFDAETFQIHEFNNEGFEILTRINQYAYDSDCRQLAQDTEQDLETVSEFVNACVREKILLLTVPT